MIHMPIVKILYKQKLFQIMLNKLTLTLQEFSNNHMIAMAYVMEYGTSITSCIENKYGEGWPNII